MYEKILVPLDGSKLGESALPHVEELVSKLSPEAKVEVTLFRVIPPQFHYADVDAPGMQIPYTKEEMTQIEKNAMDYLSKTGEALRSKGVIVKPEVSTGSAAEEIIRIADETNVDLIAMSTHGRSGLSRWAFGSVTDRVLRGGNVPILVARARQKAEKA